MQTGPDRALSGRSEPLPGQPALERRATTSACASLLGPTTDQVSSGQQWQSPNQPHRPSLQSGSTPLCNSASFHASTGSGGCNQAQSPTGGQQRYSRALLDKSSNLFQTIRQLYSSLSSVDQSQQQQQQQQQMNQSRQQVNQLTATSSISSCSTGTMASPRSSLGPEVAQTGPQDLQASQSNSHSHSTSTSLGVSAEYSAETSTGNGDIPRNSRQPSKVLSLQRPLPPPPPPPPLPPPPPPHTLGRSRTTHLAGSSALPAPEKPPTPTRRLALVEQSLEGDAALSVKRAGSRHKRATSIKSAIKHPQKWLADRRQVDSQAAPQKGAVREQYEPLITHRKLQRDRRRGATCNDPQRRQLSMDTMHLRQLTDEYLHNTGVEPRRSQAATSGSNRTLPLTGERAGSSGLDSTLVTGSGQRQPGLASSMVALTSPPPLSAITGSSVPATSGGQSAADFEMKLYRAAPTGKQHQLQHQYHSFAGSAGSAGAGWSCSLATQSSGSLATGSDDSLSHVTMLPAGEPGMADVCIQCQLVKVPPLFEPFETTGDILGTIAGPFPAQSSSEQTSRHHAHHHSHLSSTLKRGLTAITGQTHHLSANSSSAALQVMGTLKKSLSNTLEITAAKSGINSQDSLPAYSSLTNEPDELSGGPENKVTNCQVSNQQQFLSTSGSDQLCPTSGEQTNTLIGQLASKLSRQSSKKFSVSRKGLQRALSFDCRGYKKDGSGSKPSQPTGQLLSATNTNINTYTLLGSKQKAHNKSTLGLANDHSPRPYLPQSASQVDFQVPLLPYDRMQEAIVSQRLLQPNKQVESSGVASSSASSTGGGCKRAVGVAGASTIQPTGSSSNSAAPNSVVKLDANELICGSVHHAQQPASGHRAVQTDSDQSQSQSQSASSAPIRTRCSTRRRHPPNIPTITRPDEDNDDRHQDGGPPDTPQGEEAATGSGLCVDENALYGSSRMCLPSPNITVECEEGAFALPSSGQFGTNLSASDVFGPSSQLIKRPSTVVSEGLVSQALELANGEQSLRFRRQAIVPPKLSTDPHQSADREDPPVGRLVDIDKSPDRDADDEELGYSSSGGGGFGPNSSEQSERDEAARMRTLRRKRSGGSSANTERRIERIEPSTEAQQPVEWRRLSAGDSTCSLPRLTLDNGDQRQDCARAAATLDSCAPNGINAHNLSLSRRDLASASVGPLTGGAVAGATSLAVPMGPNARARRRSSIAVIPPMQICPGDLLVYSKQLIDRMNQSDEQEGPPSFLTIDDKKGKTNIWSSLKLCANFDTRTVRARNEVLSSLEDVLAALQPSTFVDEQLSHYKGMPWDEFIFETESRRSLNSSDELVSDPDVDNDGAPQLAKTNINKFSTELATLSTIGFSSHSHTSEPEHLDETPVSSAVRADSLAPSLVAPVKAVVGPETVSPSAKSRPTAGTTAPSSRFREKPKLKRGQTVDSVFRIPLVPSSPLKHAQLHQQTPTAHLEELRLIEDDEQSSLSGLQLDEQSPQVDADVNHHHRTLSTRSRRSNSKGVRDESSFETDDAMDQLVSVSSRSPARGARNQKFHQHHVKRQSSLSTISSTITRTEQKRQRALWDLFQSECAFFFDHLMTLKNVYMEPLKKIQVEGFAMFADPDVLFGNLDELCCGVYDFCKEFLEIITDTLRTKPEDLNATDVLIKLYKKNPKTEHLRAVYHRYTLNYINALTYLESLRRQVEFVEFEKWSSRDVRCKKLQLTDLLVAPVQHIMRVPIILRDIESHSEHAKDRDEIRAILAFEEASLRELDDKMRWLKNFERLLEIQKNISWPSVIELDSKLFIPDFLKEVLSKQPCEKLVVSPRRQIVHEGTLANLDSGKPCDMHVILFDDMLLLTRRKKGLTKKTSTVCKTNSGGSSNKDDGSYKYLVHKQPLSLDRFYVRDVQQADSQTLAPNDDVKQTWLFKIKKTADSWQKKNLSNGNSLTPADQPGQSIVVSANLHPAPAITKEQLCSRRSNEIEPKPRSKSSERPSTSLEWPDSNTSRDVQTSGFVRSSEKEMAQPKGRKPVELVITSAPQSDSQMGATRSN